MILVIGGVYQGKLDYALERFSLCADDVYFCNEDDVSTPRGRRIICSLDKWLLALVRGDEDVTERTRLFMENCGDAIIICRDITGGIVPIDAVQRKWRDETGRTLGTLAQRADEVIRLFCGIPTKIK